MQTQNINIQSLVARIRRFTFEISHSASANLSFITEADSKRLFSYVNELNEVIDFFQSRKPLDLPESHGSRVIELGDAPAAIKVDNEALNDVMEYLRILESELVNSQSSRMATLLIEPDHLRSLAIIKEIEDFLKNFATKVLPLDRPESSPKRAAVVDGRKGI